MFDESFTCYGHSIERGYKKEIKEESLKNIKTKEESEIYLIIKNSNGITLSGILYKYNLKNKAITLQSLNSKIIQLCQVAGDLYIEDIKVPCTRKVKDPISKKITIKEGFKKETLYYIDKT